MENFLDVVKNKYADFNGRARRQEYWMFILYQFLIILVPMIIVIAGAAMGSVIFSGLGVAVMVILGLGLFIPGLAVLVRRLHDTNKSGWFYFISIIPIVGPIILLVFLVTEGTKGLNNYGSDPKAQYELNEIGADELV